MAGEAEAVVREALRILRLSSTTTIAVHTPAEVQSAWAELEATFSPGASRYTNARYVCLSRRFSLAQLFADVLVLSDAGVPVEFNDTQGHPFPAVAYRSALVVNSRFARAIHTAHS